MSRQLWPHDKKYYKLAGARVESLIRVISDSRRGIGGLPSWIVSSRIKSDEAIQDKLRRKRVIRPTYSVEAMTDLVGVRVIVESIAAARSLAQFIRRHKVFSVGEADSEEFIDSPRADGYRGIHLIVSVDVKITELVTTAVELQIRTILQHQWSELSHSEFYKAVSEIPPNLLVRMRSLSESLQCAEIESDNLRRERILDECQRSLLGALRESILERLGDGSCSTPRQAEAVGLVAIAMLEFDKQLRRALIAEGCAQSMAVDAMIALAKDLEQQDACTGQMLAGLAKRVEAFIRSIPENV